MLSSTDIVFYRTLTGSVFLVLLYAVPGIFRRSGGSSMATGQENCGGTVGHEDHDGTARPEGYGVTAVVDGQSVSNLVTPGHENRNETERPGDCDPHGTADCDRSQGSLYIIKYPRQLAAVVLSGISMGLSWIFLYEAYRRIGVGLSSVTYYCGPVIVMMLAPLVFRSRLTGRQIICFAAAFAGILMVSLPGVTGDAKVDALGLICGFASALLHALMVIFTMKAPCITGMVNSAIQLAVSFITVALPAVIVWLVCTAGYSAGPLAPVFGSGLAIPDGPVQWFWVLFLGIVNTGVGCWLYFSEIAALPVVTVSILGYLEPLSAVFFAVLLLGESMTVWEWAGAVLILGSAAVSDLRKGRKRNV